MAEQQQQQQQELRKNFLLLERNEVSQSGGQNQNGPIEPKDLEALSQYVQEVMQQLQDKYVNMSEQVLNRIDDMSHRIEAIERSVNSFSTQAGLDSPPPHPNAAGAQAETSEQNENSPEIKEEKQ